MVNIMSWRHRPRYLLTPCGSLSSLVATTTTEHTFTSYRASSMDMARPIGPESCPVEVMDLILTRVERKDLRSYASSSRAFRRQAAHLLLQRVTISRPSHIHALSAFINSDMHSSGASCIRYLSFRALSFTSGLTKGQDYDTFIDPLLQILSGAFNISVLALVDADSFLSICAPLLKAFAALPNVRDLRVDIHLTELYNIRQILQNFASSPGRVSLSLSTQTCHRTPFCLLACPSMNSVTELRVTNMNLEHAEQHIDDEIKALPSIQTMACSATHYSYIITNADRLLRTALRTANIRDILTRLPNLRRLYLFGYNQINCQPRLVSDEEPDTWPTFDVLGAEFRALGDAKPPVNFSALDVAQFKFNDHETGSWSAEAHIPAILERYKPSRLRLKFSVKGYAERHTPLKNFMPRRTPITHLWLSINPQGIFYEAHNYELARMKERRYNLLVRHLLETSFEEPLLKL